MEMDNWKCLVEPWETLHLLDNTLGKLLLVAGDPELDLVVVVPILLRITWRTLGHGTQMLACQLQARYATRLQIGQHDDLSHSRSLADSLTLSLSMYLCMQPGIKYIDAAYIA